MMRIRHVRVRMAPRFVAMSVAVFTRRHLFMHMIMVPIVMTVCVFMLQRYVLMFMAMALRQMQNHTRQHERGTYAHQPAGGAVA